MVSIILTDIATIRSGLRALGEYPLPTDERHLFDIDIANLGKLIEDIVLFDRVLYPANSEGAKSLELKLPQLGSALEGETRHCCSQPQSSYTEPLRF